jgi:hypothetical protein
MVRRSEVGDDPWRPASWRAAPGHPRLVADCHHGAGSVMVINGHEIPFILLRLIAKEHYFFTCRSDLLKGRFSIAEDFEIGLYSASRLALENSMFYDPEVAFSLSLVIGEERIRQGELSGKNIVIIGEVIKKSFVDCDRFF